MDKNITTNGNEFFENVARLIEQARGYIGRTTDLTMCATFYEIGRMIVVKEQVGENRAEYGRKLIGGLSEYLSEHIGKGFSVTNLRNARKFYLVYSDFVSQSSIGDSEKQKSQSLISFFENVKSDSIRQSLTVEFYPFRLSWTHYLILMRIDDTDERRFYEIESINQQWTVRQLQRQYSSSLYERLALSREKGEVLKLANEGQIITKPTDMLKNPLVLEFLDMEEKAVYSESDLEHAIINKLSAFLLELGKGFSIRYHVQKRR